MQVEQLMTPSPWACGPQTNLAEAVRMMWEGDFGTLPVTDPSGILRGVITDRDISIALGTRNRPAAELRVSDVMSTPVQTCHRDDQINAALGSMRERRVRRLPVVDAEGRLCGMLSLNDVVLAGDVSLPTAEIVETLRSVSTHDKPNAQPLVVSG